MCDSFDGLGEDGSKFLAVDLSVDCDGPLWYAMLPYVLVMIAMYPIGYACGAQTLGARVGEIALGACARCAKNRKLELR